MVGRIYFIDMPYSDFKQFKALPVLVFKIIDKNDGTLHCSVYTFISLTRLFLKSFYLIQCAQQTSTPLLTLDRGLKAVAKRIGIHILEVE